MKREKVCEERRECWRVVPHWWGFWGQAWLEWCHRHQQRRSQSVATVDSRQEYNSPKGTVNPKALRPEKSRMPESQWGGQHDYKRCRRRCGHWQSRNTVPLRVGWLVERKWAFALRGLKNQRKLWTEDWSDQTHSLIFYFENRLQARIVRHQHHWPLGRQFFVVGDSRMHCRLFSIIPYLYTLDTCRQLSPGEEKTTLVWEPLL